MPHSYDLTKLDANAFEHMVNLLAIRVLGAGHTGFGPGSDGGRDGYFEGEASYPSDAARWTGTWYVQSKFHAPHLSTNPQKWLLARVKDELNEFQKPAANRVWPQNWIVATNIDPSGAPMTGAFDAARKLVREANPDLAHNFHIWGGSKILQLLAFNPDVAGYYRHFLTPGHILTEIYDGLKDARAEVSLIINHLVVRGLTDNQHTKLEQAGASGDSRPGIHRLFVDLPVIVEEHSVRGYAVDLLASALSRNHQLDRSIPGAKQWRKWNRHPSRARAWFLKGGPGQGKSTVGQFLCQIQRSALILESDGPAVHPRTRELAEKILEVATARGMRPLVPRIPIVIELREYAQWFGRRSSEQSRGILTYLAEKISTGVEIPVLPGTLKRAIGTRSWIAVFDGLDEVPHDVKDVLAKEVCHFVNDMAIEINADLFTLCTSRPQGYSGQFAELDAPTVRLSDLSPAEALECAKPVLAMERTELEAEKSIIILESAIKSSSVRELMKSPLQAHIMAIVVRDGGRPPERRWHLFTNFYHVIRRREGNRELADPRLTKLIREEEQLVKTVHSRLGFVLHAKAETSEGAITRLERSDFRKLVTEAVSQMMDSDIETTVDVLMNATTDRLVLVNTPDDGNHVRFDIRPLQEFFAAEFLYESQEAEELGRRLEVIAGDAHWREVMHFLVSALVESGRRTELSVAIRVLEGLDEGVVESVERLAAKRAARGALLSARLLQEGVLEQDKRQREQFRNALRPLCGLTEPAKLESMAKDNHEQSGQWLTTFLFQSLADLSYSENIGSAVFLSYLLRDADSRVADLTAYLRKAPRDYLAYVAACRGREEWHGLAVRPSPQIENQTWLITIFFEMLRDPHWYEYGPAAIRTTLRLLRASSDVAIRVATDQGVPAEELNLLIEVLQPTILIPGESVRYGVIEALHLREDWTTGIAEERQVNIQALLLNRAPGVWGVIQNILRFGASRTQENLRILAADLVRVGPEVTGVIPDQFRAFIPHNPHGEEISATTLAELEEDAFQRLITTMTFASHRIPRPSVRLVLQGPPDTAPGKQWDATANWSPEILLEVFTVYRAKGPTSRKRLNGLVDQVLERPAIAANSPHMWGSLVRASGEREPDLRRALVASVAFYSPLRRGWPGSGESFVIKLPDEAPLIPHIASTILGTFRPEKDFRTTDAGIVSKLSQSVSGYFPDPEVLRRLVDDPTFATRLRSGALLLLAMHPSFARPLQLLSEMAAELYAPRELWYVESLVSFLNLWGRWSDAFTQSIVSQMLNATRENYAAREILQGLLTNWREASVSPVTERDLIASWLTGT